MSKLFSNLKIKNMDLKNRIVMAPMCMDSCNDKDGIATNWHFVHYSTRAIGGGLITSPLMAEEMLCNGRSDLVYLGRELLRNPYWALAAANQLKETIEWPVQYQRSNIVSKNGF